MKQVIKPMYQAKDIKPLLTVVGDSSYAGVDGRLVEAIDTGKLGLRLEEVIQLPDLEGPNDLGIATIRAHPSGSGVIFVSDQRGLIYRIENGGAQVYLNIRDHVSNFQSGPGIATGLGSFIFHPNFLENGLLYITHAETYLDQEPDFAVYADTQKAVVQWVLGEWKVEDIESHTFKGSHRELIRLHAPNFGHGAQDLGFVPNLDKNDSEYGLLYFGYGDGGVNNLKKPELCGHSKSFLGTILRIDPQGSNSNNGKYGIPGDNPFADSEDPEVVREIYALGFRNPHRMCWDPLNDFAMLATDIGESNIEEINLIKNGGHYGWPYKEGIFGINTLIDPKRVFKIDGNTTDDFIDPIKMYDHQDGNAISGGFVYDGSSPLLYGKYIFGDIVNGRLFYTDRLQEANDPKIHELLILHDSKRTSLRELTGLKRMHLRVWYDAYQKIPYVTTKTNDKIYKIVDVEESSI